MARNKDNAPVENTCPKIDQVIGFLEKVYWDLPDDEKCFECEQIVKVMEKIRKDNSDLRTWGNEEYNSKYEYEEEIKNLKADLSVMIDEIKDLKAEIETLEEKLSDVESV